MSVTEAAPVASCRVSCAHCGLPVPAGRVPRTGARAFCCTGCDTAWQVLEGAGLGHYHSLALRRERAVEPSGRTFEEFDHDAFRDRYVRMRRDGLAETELFLEGVQCPSCVWLVERVPTALAGMASAELDLARGRVRVAWDPGQVALSAIARFLDTIGYRPHPFRGGRAEERRRREDRAMLVRIGVSGALAINTMLASLALYSGWFSGMERDWERYFRIVSLVLAAPALFGPGRVFLRGAFGALRARLLHMDVPVAIALLAAFARGVVNTVTDRGPVYFDGVAMLVFLLLVGRFLQQRAARSAADSAELLYGLTPSRARVRGADGVREIPAEALLPGMETEVRSGETVPADGVVIEGASALDTSWLTGESRPREVAPGDVVHAGTVCRGATIALRVERAGEDTRLAHLLQEVERGAARRAPVVRTADRIAGGFVAVVLVLAAITWWLWQRSAPADALDHAIALLIVTCPCALALATPLAVTVAIGRAARAGMLVKGGDTLESLAVPGTLVLDKTGTLTEGRPALLHWSVPAGLAPEVQRAVLALERESTHPFALAFQEAWPGREAALAAEVRVTPSAGVSGRIEDRDVRVGSPSWIAGHTSRVAAGVETSMPDTLSPVWVAIGDTVVAVAGFGDRIRPEAASTLERLRARGWVLELLSGDEPAVVRATGAALGFAPGSVQGGVSPEEKRARIEAHAARGPVVMVGDGVNDAAAIAVATVGVGVRGGAEACLAAADVYLATPGIGSLASLTCGARRTLRTIRLGLALSLVWNVAGAGLAMAGLVTPLVAALAMPLSSLSVVLLAWRARTFEPERA